jgi:hypothetical protein
MSAISGVLRLAYTKDTVKAAFFQVPDPEKMPKEHSAMT